MILGVTGGRDFADRDLVFETLDELKRTRLLELVVHGACPTGADRFTEQWCHRTGIDMATFPALWHARGKRAGPIRNAAMLRFIKIDLVVAFPGNRGTADMIAKARLARIPVTEVTHQGALF